MNDLARNAEANRNFPLRAVIAHAGIAAADLKYDTRFNCPFCGGSLCAVVFKLRPYDSELFKCLNDESCPDGNNGLDAVQFIALYCKDVEDPKTFYYKEARLRARRLYLEDEPLIEQCIELLRWLGDHPWEGNFTISLIQRRLSVGFIRAARVMAVLETRGIVSPYQVKPSRDILKLPELPPAQPVPGEIMNGIVQDDTAHTQAIGLESEPISQALPDRAHEPAADIDRQSNPATTECLNIPSGFRELPVQMSAGSRLDEIKCIDRIGESCPAKVVEVLAYSI